MSPRKPPAPKPPDPNKASNSPGRPRVDGTPQGQQRPLVPMREAPGLHKSKEYSRRAKINNPHHHTGRRRAMIAPDGTRVDSKGRPASPGHPRKQKQRIDDPLGDNPAGNALVDPMYGYNFNNMCQDGKFYRKPINKFTATVDAPEIVARINQLMKTKKNTAELARAWAEEFKSICAAIRKLYPSHFGVEEFAVLGKATKLAIHSWMFSDGVPWTKPGAACAHLRCMCRHRIIPLMIKQERTKFPVYTLPDTAEPDEFLMRDPRTDLDMLLQRVLLDNDRAHGDEYIEESARELVLPPEPEEEKGVDAVPDMNRLFVKRRPGKE